MSSRQVPALLLLIGVTAAGVLAEETRTVAAGPQFKAGGFHRFWFGDGYRDLWTAPIEVPVLDLQKTGGGLTPVRVVGQAQGLGLAFKGADGKAYTFRSLHKHPERMLPESLRDRWPAKIAQDQSSHTHPAAGLILSPLQEAAGIAHTNPQLVVVPDDPALGEFRKMFAGEFGTIDEFPLPAADGRPGFMGATEIASTTALWKRWLEGPGNRIDSPAFLRARVLDLWVDNFDRHRGQWRWMRIPGQDLYQPLPEDPDMVLVHHDGFLMANLRGRIPKQLKFGPEYTSKLEGPLSNNFEVDRWLLSDLDRDAWEKVAKDLAGLFTMEVTDSALRRMPAQWYAINGKETLAALEKRRAGLVDYVLRVYDYYAKDVDVHATDRAEVVTLARAADDSLEVTIALADRGASPWYRRRFLPGETDEVRVYLHGGDDRVARSGPAGGPIRVRVVAGGGKDVVDDSRSGETEVWRDAGTVEVARGQGTSVREKAWVNPHPVKDAPWLEPRSHGHWTVGNAVVAYHPDVELVLGYGFTRTAWGFRTEPASSVQSIRAAVASGDGTGKVQYGGTFRRPASGLALRFETFLSDIEQFNYFGYGNESLRPPSYGPGYRAAQTVAFASPTLRYDLGRRLETYLGPEVRYSSAPLDDETTIGIGEAYGTGKFGQVALRGGLHFNSRARTDFSSPLNIAEGLSVGLGAEQINGVDLRVSGLLVPEAWDVTSSYGAVDGVAAAYLGSPRAHVAFRVGGRHLWGTYPWFEAAAVGGLNNRGFVSRRFIGDSSLFAGVSLRAWLGSIPSPIVPVRVGLVGFAQTGRVWFGEEVSDTWHNSVGGGLLLQPLAAPVTLHAVVGHSKESTLFYFGLGYPF
jgi:hypothetical protein